MSLAAHFVCVKYDLGCAIASKARPLTLCLHLGRRTIPCKLSLCLDRFFAGEGQSQESTTSATMIEWLDVVNNIFRRTNFEGGIGIGIQVKVAAVCIRLL